MKLIVTEKADAARQIANLLSSSRPSSDKVYNTPIYRFDASGEECVTIGLRGHILEVDFTPELTYTSGVGWQGIGEDGQVQDAYVPDSLAHPPFKKKKPFTQDGVDLKGWKMEALPYLAFAPVEKLPKEKEIIRSLKNLARKADSIVIATDFDREGELIGFDALTCCREVNKTAPVTRARYSSFTKPEITKAFSNPDRVDTNLAQAGETRQDIDLIWGAALTRYLTLVKFAGYGNVRSSGRVQTPTLALIVARERERLAHVPEDFWVIKADFDAGAEVGPTAPLRRGVSGDSSDSNADDEPPETDEDTIFTATHKTARFKTEEEAKAVMEAIELEHSGRVVELRKKVRKVAPPAPFNTTSLMAAASSIGITPARCMRMAESLYMKGFISYPRVDNTVYPPDLNLRGIVSALRENPAYSSFCSKLLSLSDASGLHPTRGKTRTTDHPPIYPTACAQPGQLNAAEYKLYNLVARRFLATLSQSAEIENTHVVVDVAGEDFVASGDVVKSSGFREIYPYGMKRDENLPPMEEGQVIAFNGATLTHDQTKPPARYSQGRLIQEMEKAGLGTKSTRHAIIERLYAVKYIHDDPIEPSALGMAVIDALNRFAPHITHPEMTAELEEGMTRIADGKVSKDAVVLESRQLLYGELEKLIPAAEEVAQVLGDAVSADAYIGKCPKCGHDLQIRTSSKTRTSFVGCSAWPECDVTYPLPKGKIEAVDEPCPVCGLPQIKVTAFRSKSRVICIDPECPTNAEEDLLVGTCPTCAKNGKTSRLFAHRNPKTLKRSVVCENYEECKTRYPLPQAGEIIATDEVCPACGAPYVIVKTARGPWKLCPNFDCPSREEKSASSAKGKTGGSTGSKRSSARRTSRQKQPAKTA